MTLPWYPRDMGKYARDTKHLTMMEHGAYNLMLDYYYSTGGLPQVSNASSNASLMPDHSRIYRLCSAMSKSEQDAVDNVLNLFFKLGADGFYRQEKADKVLEEQTLKHEKRVEAGRKGGSSKAGSNASSNTPQKKTQTKTKKYNPLPPNAGKADGTGKGFFLDGREGGGWTMDRVQSKLNDEALQRAKQNAPGWDIYRLMEIYANGINERGEPKSINAAFPAWCGKYTKGKRP